MTKRFSLILFAAASLLPAVAHASGYGVSGSGAGYSGSGTITATDQGAGEYLITDISGTGFQGLFMAGGFNGNDNLLFPNATEYVDGSGFAFTIAGNGDTDNVDILFDGSAYQAYIVDEGGTPETVPVTFNLARLPNVSTRALTLGALYSPLSSFATTTQFAFNFQSDGIPPAAPQTPEPSSLLLLGTGVAGVFGEVRRRRSKC